MAETIILDPAAVATARSEFDLTPWISSEGIDWGDAQVEQYLADAERGQVPVDFRIPNRQITIPLRIKQHSAVGFDEARRRIQAKAALFQRRGGWLKRTLSNGQSYYLDVTNALLKMSGGWLQAHRDVDTDASLVLDAIPDFYGDEEGSLADDFSTDGITSGAWVLDAGSGTISITGGQLVPSSIVEKRIFRTGVSVYDHEATIKFTTGAAPAGTNLGLIVKWRDSSNYFLIRASGTSINILKRDDGAFSAALVSASFTLLAATSYWLRGRIEGNKLTVELFTSAPTPISSPAATATYTLTGGEITEFGQGVPGGVGIRVVPSDTAERYDDWSLSERVYVEKTNAELVSPPIYGIRGDYPARVRIVVDELDNDAQLGLIAALRARHYSAAVTAQSRYEAEALTPLDLAAIATLTGASGGGSNNAVTHANLGTDWTPVLSTDIASVGAMTHTGTNVIWVRVHTTSSAPPELRLVYDIGDLTLPEELPAVAIPGSNNLYMIPLGQVRLDGAPVGTHRWKGVIQAKGAVGGENVTIDLVEVVNADEFYAVLSALANADPGLVAYSARDPFNQIAGALNGKTAAVGGNWVSSGDPDDFTVETTGKTAQRSAVSDSDFRWAISGLAAFAAQVVQVDLKASAFVAGDTTVSLQGVVARYTDASNRLAAHLFGDNPRTLAISKTVGGVSTVLRQVDVPASEGAWQTLRLLVDAAGRFFVWWFAPGSAPGEPVLIGQDTALATGGGLASGKVGFRDFWASSAASVRNYDNFQAWVPTLDAVVHANQTAELRTDGMFRKDATGAAYGKVPHVIDALPRIMPAGLENTPSELFLKGSRGDLELVPDTGIDDIRAQVLARASWLTVPAAA